jgi:UDP-glucose 4-epimerase
MPKRILITGASGYIGRQLSQRLSEDYTVIGVDIRPTDDANHIQCDIRDPKLADILSEHQVSHVGTSPQYSKPAATSSATTIST